MLLVRAIPYFSRLTNTDSGELSRVLNDRLRFHLLEFDMFAFKVQEPIAQAKITTLCRLFIQALRMWANRHKRTIHSFPSSVASVSSRLPSRGLLPHILRFGTGVLLPRIVPEIGALPALAPTRSYWLTRTIFLRSLGAIFTVAFWVALMQNKALIGDDVSIAGTGVHGIVPSHEGKLVLGT